MSTTPPNPLDSRPIPTLPSADLTRKLNCEFCNCRLTPNGEIIEMGEKAKTFRLQEETKEKLNKTISDLQAENADLKRQVQALTPAEPNPVVETSRQRLGVVVSSS